jgi:hypothetical protein
MCGPPQHESRRDLLPRFFITICILIHAAFSYCSTIDELSPLYVWKFSSNCKFHFGAPYKTDSHLSRQARCTCSICYKKNRTDSKLRLSSHQLWFKVSPLCRMRSVGVLVLVTLFSYSEAACSVDGFTCIEHAGLQRCWKLVVPAKAKTAAAFG